MIPYILHVTVITTICFLFYKLLLQKETFYRLNRWTLLGCLAVSFGLPLLPVPSAWSWQDKWREKETTSPVAQIAPIDATVQPTREPIVYETTHPARKVPYRRSKHRNGNSVSWGGAKAGGVASGHATTGKGIGMAGVNAAASGPVTANEVASGPVTQGPAAVNEAAAAQQPPVKKEAVVQSASIGALLLLAVQWLFYCYLFGVVLFGANFLLQLAVLLYQSYSRPVIRDGRFRIVEVSGNRAPCSFGNTIFVNPENYDWETYNQILIHEKIHVSGRHTLDIVLAEIALVIQWFNPFAWLYRREVENNLEFLTDAHVLLHREVERSAYQLSLLRVSAPHLPFSLTNNYNQSLLKRRIVMMNSQRSSLQTIWKYFFLIPILALLVCALNKPVAAFGAATGSTGPGYTVKNGDGLSALSSLLPLFRVSATAAMRVKDTTIQPEKRDTMTGKRHRKMWSDDDDRDYIEPPMAPEAKINLSIDAAPYVEPMFGDGLKMDIQPKIALQPKVALLPKIAWDDQRSLADMDIKLNLQPKLKVDIMPIPQIMFPADSELRDGSWFVTSYGDRLSFELRAADEDHSWNYTLRVDKNEISPFPGQGNVEFKLVREAGTVSFKGQFDGQEGFGHFHYDPDESFFAALKQMGVEDPEDRRRFGFFALNVKKDYVKSIVDNGYAHISERDVLRFASMHIDKDFIAYWHGSGIADADDPRTITRLKAMKIDRAYVDELKAAGYDHLSLREVETLKAQRIDKAYIRSLGRYRDNTPIPVRELITYKAMHVDSAYLEGLRKAGYNNLTPREVSQLYAWRVTPDYIQGLATVGYKDLDARQLGTLKAMEITPEFIKGFADIGYGDLNARELGGLKAMNITPDFVKGFKEIGYDHVPINVLRQLKAMGVTPDYVSKMKKQGFNSNDLTKYIRLKADFN